MTTQLVLDAVEHAIWTRGRYGVAEDLAGRIITPTLDAQDTSVEEFSKQLSVGTQPHSTRIQRGRTRSASSGSRQLPGA